MTWFLKTVVYGIGKVNQYSIELSSGLYWYSPLENIRKYLLQKDAEIKIKFIKKPIHTHSLGKMFMIY